MSEEFASIAGFWKRVGAFILDTILIGLVGFILGMFLGDLFAQLGNWGRLVGFIIALVYFATLNSNLGGGKTLGKRIVGIRVVDAQGECISLPRSIVRYFVFATPFILNGLQIQPSQFSSIYTALLVFTIFGGIISIVYLYIFNRVTRQSLHDLVVGTYVVNDESEVVDNLTVWKLHYGVVGTILTAALLLPLFTQDLAVEEPFSAMLKTQEKISNLEPVKFASIVTSTTFFDSIKEESKTTHTVTVQAFLRSSSVEDEELAQEIGRIVLENYADAYQKDGIYVVLTFGYDIGIAQSWSSFTYSYSPEELTGEAI